MGSGPIAKPRENEEKKPANYTNGREFLYSGLERLTRPDLVET